MDPSKQNLSPELKEVYDRVMNTQTAKPAAGAQPAAPASSMPSAPSAAPQTTPPVEPPVQAATPAMGVQTTTSAPVMPSAPSAMPSAPVAPSAPSASPQAPSPTTFVFNGGKVSTPNAKTEAASGKKKFPTFLIPVGILVLVVAWAILWAKIFKLF